MVAKFGKKRKEKFQYTKIALQALAILFIFAAGALAFVDFKIYKKRKELESQVKHYQEQIEKLGKSNQELKLGIDNADNVEYLEKIAYEQLGEQKPGETAVIFVAPEQKILEPLPPKNIWTGWLTGFWQWIKNRF